MKSRIFVLVLGIGIALAGASCSDACKEGRERTSAMLTNYLDTIPDMTPEQRAQIVNDFAAGKHPELSPDRGDKRAYSCSTAPSQSSVHSATK